MPKLVLFTASWCGPCKELKTWLVSNDISQVNIIDVDESADDVPDFVEVLPTLVMSDNKDQGIFVGREEIKPYLLSLNN